MENHHLPIYQYLHQYPFLFYRSWNQPNYFCPKGAVTSSKQIETRESLEETPKLLKVNVERTPKNDPIANQKKSKKAIFKEKLQKKKEREDNFQRKTQKKNRNLPSNIFKYLSNFFYYNPNIIQNIGKLIPDNLTVSASNIAKKFKQAISFGQSYIRPSVVQFLCKQGTFTKDQALVFRIILRKFLLIDMPLFIMSQSKLKRKQRAEYIKMGRKIFGQIKKSFLNE